MVYDNERDCLQEYESEYFSASRHYERLQELPIKTDTQDQIQLDSIINRNSDVVLSHGISFFDIAKMLLHEWVYENPSLELQDEFQFADDWLQRFDPSKPSFDEPIEDLGLKNIQKQVSRNIVRVRGESKRKVQSISNPKHEKIKDEIAIQIIKTQYQQERLEQERLKSSKDTNESLIEWKQQQDVKKELEIQKELQRLHQLEKEKMLQASYWKAEQLLKGHVEKRKRLIFYAWVGHRNQMKLKWDQWNSVTSLKHTMSNFHQWKQFTLKKQEKRNSEWIKYQIKKDQMDMIKSSKHDRFRVLSKCICAWKQFVIIQEQTRNEKRLHEKRLEQMNLFLVTLQKRHQQNDSVGNITMPQQKLNEIQEKLEAVDQKVGISNEIPNQSLPKVKPLVVPEVVKSKPKKASKKDQEWLEKMNLRESLRQQRKQMIQSQKEQRQKQLLLEQELERLRKKEQEEKEQDLLRKEKKRVEQETRMILEEKQRQKMHSKQMLMIAIQFHQRKIQQKFGLKPFQLFIQFCKRNEGRATRKYQAGLYKKVLLLMFKRITRKEEERLLQGQQYYEVRLQQNMFAIMRQQQHQKEKKYLLAVYVSCKHQYETLFGVWRRLSQHTKKTRLVREKVNNDKADNYAKRFVPKKVFRIWKHFVQEQKEQKWREYRRARLREAAKLALQESSIGYNSKVDLFDM